MLPGVLVIGVGNDYRGDDRVGLVVARQIKDVGLPGVAVLEREGEATTLISAWSTSPAKVVIVIDAVVTGNLGVEVGLVRRIDINHEPIPADYRSYSTHAFGLAEAVELAQVLDQLPPQMIIYGIEGRNFAHGSDLSPEVEQAAIRVVDQIIAEISELRGASRPL